MKAKDDGGTAFPVQDSHDVHVHYGMSLRDWFAGMALQGMLANNGNGPSFETMDEYLNHYSTLSYTYADAMLAARKGEQT